MGLPKLLQVLTFILPLGAAAGGPVLPEVAARQQDELESWRSGFETRVLELDRKYGEALQLYLTGKGPYPAALARRYSELDAERSAHLRDFRVQGLPDIQKAAEADRIQQEKASDGSVGVTEALRVEAQPAVVIDGSGVPREIQFSGPKKPAGSLKSPAK